MKYCPLNLAIFKYLHYGTMDKQKIDLDHDDLSQGLGDNSALIFTEVLLGTSCAGYLLCWVPPIVLLRVVDILEWVWLGVADILCVYTIEGWTVYN